MPHGETVTRLRAAATADPYSTENTDLDWSSPDMVAITGVAVEPLSSTEPIDAGLTRLEVDLRLYLPFEADVRPLDRVVVRGDTYSVEGSRLDWLNPFTGDTPGSVVDVQRVP